MSTVKVQIRYQFAPVPRELAQNPKVTARTLGVITYLCSKGESWSPRVYDIRKRFNLGERAWSAVSQEMRLLGILDDKKTRNGTDLVFDPHGVVEEKKVIHKPPRHFSTLLKPTPAKCRDIDHIDPNLERLSIKDHIHNDFKKKLSMKERMEALNSDQRYLFDKLSALDGIFKAVILSILETHTIAQINNVLEMAVKDGVKNPGRYVVKCLYKKGLVT